MLLLWFTWTLPFLDSTALGKPISRQARVSLLGCDIAWVMYLYLDVVKEGIANIRVAIPAEHCLDSRLTFPRARFNKITYVHIHPYSLISFFVHKCAPGSWLDTILLLRSSSQTELFGYLVFYLLLAFPKSRILVKDSFSVPIDNLIADLYGDFIYLQYYIF